eukprot:GHUV01055264.1.p1 GENE.GHUV01055264.1~~GHUV01055264.1.p1  ORF type:complete len:110 (-),score=7.72 GHUV01055264.1:224-553(-)
MLDHRCSLCIPATAIMQLRDVVRRPALHGPLPGSLCNSTSCVCAGDSVALLARGGQSQRLTVEHRLDNEAEVERVLEAGGRVVSFKPGGTPRVMGTSSQTRFKGSMVTR